MAGEGAQAGSGLEAWPGLPCGGESQEGPRCVGRAGQGLVCSFWCRGVQPTCAGTGWGRGREGLLGAGWWQALWAQAREQLRPQLKGLWGSWRGGRQWEHAQWASNQSALPPPECREVAASKFDLNYIGLDGSIGEPPHAAQADHISGRLCTALSASKA